MKGSVTQVSVKDSVAQKETRIEVSELSNGELVAKFKPNNDYLRGLEDTAAVVMYITGGVIVLHIESQRGKEYRDDCLLIDGFDIAISTGEKTPYAHIRDWRDPKKRTLEPASHEK